MFFLVSRGDFSQPVFPTLASSHQKLTLPGNNYKD